MKAKSISFVVIAVSLALIGQWVGVAVAVLAAGAFYESLLRAVKGKVSSADFDRETECVRFEATSLYAVPRGARQYDDITQARLDGWLAAKEDSARTSTDHGKAS